MWDSSRVRMEAKRRARRLGNLPLAKGTDTWAGRAGEARQKWRLVEPKTAGDNIALGNFALRDDTTGGNNQQHCHWVSGGEQRLW